jgi:hypothetical protein
MSYFSLDYNQFSYNMTRYFVIFLMDVSHDCLYWEGLTGISFGIGFEHVFRFVIFIHK